jgi:signal transduction histidine kinase
MYKRKVSFREDLRNKFILFAIVPIFLLGIFGSFLVYNAEEKTIIDNHNKLLVSVSNRIENFHSKLIFLTNAIKKELNSSITTDEDIVEDTLAYDEDVYSVYEVNLTKNEVINVFKDSHEEKILLDKNIKKLIKKAKFHNGDYLSDAYYLDNLGKVVISYTLKAKDDIYYIFNISLDRVFRFISSLAKDNKQSISIINKKGQYIFNSLHPEYVREKKNFFKTGAYYIAVKNANPFELTEFPANYKKGDNFWKGIFDDDNFLTYTKEKNTNWLIVIRDFYDNLDPFLNKMLTIAVIFILISVTLTLISVKITTNKIMTPLEDLIAQINRFANGQKKNYLKIDQDNTYPIFASLINSFNNMQKKINQREEELENLNQNLEKIVKEKTKSLEELNKNLEKIIEEKVNENLEIQKRLTQSEKLASMGEMIGNIAHQWRQPLSVISTIATGIKTQKEFGILSDEEFFKACDDINENAQYLSRTIDDFRNFIKGDKTRVIFPLSTALESFLNIIDSQIKSYHIDLILDVDESIEIDGYKNDLIQSMINIFNNSKDAFKLNNVEEKMFSIKAFVNKKGRVQIEMTDNGGGIKEDIINRIFEPYFTTKHKSQGTGLGLHMTYKLITSMDGEIEASNVEFEYKGKHYKGAKFTIYLPAVD